MRPIVRGMLALPSRKLQAGIGGLAGALVGLRLPVVSVGEEVFTLSLSGVTVSLDADIGMVVRALNLLLLFGTFYAASIDSLDRLYPRRRSFRALVSGTAVAVAATLLALRGAGGTRLVAPLMGAFFGSALLFAAYLRLVTLDWQAFAAAYWRRLSALDSTDGEVSTRNESRLVLLLAAFVAALAALFMGVLGSVLLSISPALELFVLAWVGGNALASARPSSAGDPIPDRRSKPAVEGRLFVVLDQLGDPKGNATALVVTVGVLVSAVATVTALDLALSSYPSLSWIETGYVLTLLLVAAYGLWFWLRVAERLPAFLAAWHSETSSTETTRPPGVMLPLFAATVPFGLHARRIGPVPALSDSGYAVAWPFGAATIVVAALWARRIEPQAPGTDGRAIPAAAVVQAGAFLFAIPYAAENGYLFLTTACLILGPFFAPDLRVVVGRPISTKPFLVHAGYHALVAGVLGLIALRARPPVAPTATLVGVAYLLLRGSATAFEYVEETYR